MNAISGVYQHTSIPVITRPEQMRSAEEIVKELERLLFGTTDPDEQEKLAPEGRVLTLTYKQFHDVAGRTRISPYIYHSIAWETESSWIVIGYGDDVILIGTDYNHAPPK